MLLDKGAAVDQEDVKGRTALIHAVAEGKDEVMRILVAHKADVNQQGRGWRTLCSPPSISDTRRC